MNPSALPSKIDIISELRALNATIVSPQYVCLYCERYGCPDAKWSIAKAPANRRSDITNDRLSVGREYVRGDGKFDAYMVASRLLTAAKDAGY